MWPDWPPFASDATRVAPRGQPQPMIGPAQMGMRPSLPLGPVQQVYNAGADIVPSSAVLRALKDAWRNPSLATLGGVAMATMPLARPSKRVVKLLDEIDLGGQKIARYATDKGDAWVTYTQGPEGLEIVNIGAQGGPRSLGVSGVRSISDDLMSRTGATMMRGNRVSGASIGRDASIEMRKPDMLSEAKQMLQQGEAAIQRTDALTASRPALQRLNRQTPPSGSFIGPVLEKYGLPLTKAEGRYFDELLGNPANAAELLEAVPSLKRTKTGIDFNPQHSRALDEFIEGSVMLREAERLPPSFYSGSLQKRIVSGK